MVPSAGRLAVPRTPARALLGERSRTATTGGHRPVGVGGPHQRRWAYDFYRLRSEETKYHLGRRRWGRRLEERRWRPALARALA